MLDKFIAGRVTRISPEAPVPVVMFDHESHRIGGAANVAHNVTALGGRATLVAVSGQDEAAATLASACREAGIAPVLIGDSARPTTTKVRIVTERNQQVARVDYEMDAEVSGDVEQRIITTLQQHSSDASAIVVSDYLKGCVTARVMQAVVAAGKERGIPVLVDPEDSAHRLLRRRHRHHAEPPRSGDCRQHAGAHRRRCRRGRRARSANAPGATRC